MKKLTCHCGGVEAEVKLPENGFEMLSRCNCSICKRKGYVMTPINPENIKIIKGKDILTLYQYHTKVAEHYFCSKCGTYTHSNPRSNHDKAYIARCGKVSNKLYFESKKESKLNQSMNIKTRSSYDVDNYYQDMKIMLKNLD